MCVCVRVCVFYIVYIYCVYEPTHTETSYSIHPSVDGHLGRFRVSAFVNEADMNVEVEISSQVSACVPCIYFQKGNR